MQRSSTNDDWPHVVVVVVVVVVVLLLLCESSQGGLYRPERHGNVAN